jgi:hypothetical protein
MLGQLPSSTDINQPGCPERLYPIHQDERLHLAKPEFQLQIICHFRACQMVVPKTIASSAKNDSLGSPILETPQNVALQAAASGADTEAESGGSLSCQSADFNLAPTSSEINGEESPFCYKTY